MKAILVRYGALLKEQAGLAKETVLTDASDAGILFDQLRQRHGFRFGCATFVVVINNELRSLTDIVNDGDEVLFLPPMSGG